jgi:uncharacterized phage protein (TIGR02216 family)
MEIGMGKLGLSPAEFWKMTPLEYRAKLRGRFGKPEARERPLTMDEVRKLYKRVMDGKHGTRSSSSQA